MKKIYALTLIVALFINMLTFSVYATASVPAGYVRVEAESFTEKSGATQVQDDSQASNGKLVGVMTGDNDYFTLNYNSPISGVTDAIIYGAIHRDAGTGDAHYQIIVNDGAAADVTIPRSSIPTWSDYKAVPFTITLNEGANKIVVKRNGQYLPANIDCIDISSTPKNFALGKTAEVSSVWPGGETIVGGDKVTDGNVDTRWASAPNGTSASITIDFGTDVNFNSVMFVLYGDSPIMRVQAYSISYYANGQWTECYKNTVGVAGSSTQNVSSNFINVTGSKLKIDFTKPESVDISIYEVEVNKLAGGIIWDNNTLNVAKTSNNNIDFSWDAPKTSIFTNYVLLKDGNKVTDISTSDVTTNGNTVSYSFKNENLLLNKPTTGSNFWPTLPQSLATDGNMDSRWADIASSPSATIEVDMLKETAVDTLVIKEAFSPRITSFKIELYKNGTWTTAFDGMVNGDIKTVQFPSTVGSKLRLSTVGTEATIFELEAYNSSAFSNNGTFKLEAVDLLGALTTNGPAAAIYSITYALEAKILEAQALVENNYIYGWAGLQTAIQAGQALVIDQNVTIQQAALAVTSIDNAINGLVLHYQNTAVAADSFDKTTWGAGNSNGNKAKVDFIAGEGYTITLSVKVDKSLGRSTIAIKDKDGITVDSKKVDCFFVTESWVDVTLTVPSNGKYTLEITADGSNYSEISDIKFKEGLGAETAGNEIVFDGVVINRGGR